MSIALSNPHREIKLDSGWKLLLDPENVGLIQEWYLHPEIMAVRGEDIPVPAAWEEVYPHYDAVGWYLNRFNLPEAEGTVARLCFGAVNYKADVWLNGLPVGGHGPTSSLSSTSNPWSTRRDLRRRV